MAASHNSMNDLSTLTRKAQLLLHDLALEVGRQQRLESTVVEALKKWRIETYRDGEQYVLLPVTTQLLSLLRDKDKF